MLHVGYGVGNMVGPQTFQASQAPSYTGGITASLVTFCASAGFMGFYWLFAAWQNKAKEKKYGQAPVLDTDAVDVLVHEYMDKTDVEQPYFRYIT